MGVLNLRSKRFPDLEEARSSFAYLNKVVAYTKTGLPLTNSLKATN